MNIRILSADEARALLDDQQFRAQWLRLYGDCPWSTAFQHPDFAAVWYGTYRPRYEPLLVLSNAADGTLEGLLALARSLSDGGLVAAGAGQAEYQVWLARPELGDTFAGLALPSLRERLSGRPLTLRYLPPGTPTGWLAEPHARRLCSISPHRRPLLRLGDGDEIARSLRQSSKKSRLNRLNKIGPLSFRRIIDPRDFERLFDDIIECYDIRHAMLHHVSPFRSDELKRPFHLALMNVPDLLHVSVLTLGDQLGAAHIGLGGRKQVHLGIVAHNPALEKHSPGTIHLLFLAQLLREEGYEQFDLTPGDDPYKERMANSWDEVHTLTVYASSGQRRKQKFREFVKRGVKKALQTVRLEPRHVRSVAGRLKNLNPFPRRH